MIITGTTLCPRCQVDGSWTADALVFGRGTVLELEDGSSRFGLLVRKTRLSPINAELEALIWTMKIFLQISIFSMAFETDCLQLVKAIEEEEHWPTLESELEEFNMVAKNKYF
ncbi:unnamed protein product [Thlaspi arvense]|uniref:RNase H type-1 domain-containing protein n=1 Tax=Thlaspi arvense TaxID=13288 RepID=A0AAU9SDI7_THLAR|nr:unnamed protein product [Thlaspi arvense]